MAIFTIQHLRTKNDTNGNPRRVFVVREIIVYGEDDRADYYRVDGYSRIVLTVDEGYGESETTVADMVHRSFSGAVVVPLGAVDVMPATYRRMLKDYPNGTIGRRPIGSDS